MRILFMGRKKHAAEMLKWTVDQGHEVVSVVTDNHINNSPTAAMCRQLQIKMISLEEAKEFAGEASNMVDLVISYLYWRKIKEPLISSPRIGCINFHPAPLPDWKGVAGYNIAILNKLSTWGASAHVVDENIDTGSIIKIFRFNFDHRLETASSLEQKTQHIQRELYKSVLTDISEYNGIKGPLIPNTGGTYITKKEMLKMMKVLPGDDIDAKIRAFWYPPHHGAYIEINNVKYTLVNDLILNKLQ